MKNNFKNLVSHGGVDLHCHTKISDGKYAIHELLDNAISYGFSAIAITDHNSVYSDIKALQKKYKKQGLSLICGAEITATYETGSGKNEEIHIVALDFNPEKMQHIFEQSRQGRELYIKAILSKLKESGIANIEYPEMEKHFDSYYLGKMHVAQMMYEKGAVKSVYEALDEFVGNLGKRKCYVSSKDYIEIPDMKTVIQAILDAGGVPILAHPFYYKSLTDEERENLIITFKKLAREKAGMEVYYKDYDHEQTKILEELAAKHNLKPSAGSDFHGWSDNESIMQFNPNILKNLVGGIDDE